MNDKLRGLIMLERAICGDSYGKIGCDYNITGSRVRQIVLHAARMVQHPDIWPADHYAGYYDGIKSMREHKHLWLNASSVLKEKYT